MSADRPDRRHEAFADYHARCRRELRLVRAHARDPGARDPGRKHRLVWYEARLEAMMLSDPDLARAIEAMGPVRPSISGMDLRAVRMHALVGEVERRQRLSGHERVAEAIVRRRLVTEACGGEDDERTSDADRGRPKVR